MQIKKEILVPAGTENLSDLRIFRYARRDGLELTEKRELQRESDFSGGLFVRESPDNGHTWGPWHDEYATETEKLPGSGDELTQSFEAEVWNPIHEHYISCGATRYFVGGHTEAYRVFWGEGRPGFYDHQYIRVRGENDTEPESTELIRYEDGADFDRKNPRNPAFLSRNQGYFNSFILLRNGDVAVPVSATVRTCCRIAGLDVQEIFPSIPDIMKGTLVARGRWDAAARRYRFTFSNPVILSDLQSSRGVDEPMLAQLSGDRILLVARASNVQSAGWRTRIAKGTPGYKWFSLSNDGGQTFTTPQPWRFDTGESFCSPASIGRFLRSEKTGKLWWFGNITGPDVYGNGPRWPLCAGQVDDETGLLRRETVELIDTRAPKDQEHVQFSNFWLYQDRETGDIIMTLVKIGQFGSKMVWKSDCMRYTLTE